VKISKIETAISLLAIAFLFFTAGWFLRGEHSAEPLQIETQRTLTQTATASSTPASASPSVSPAGTSPTANVNQTAAGDEETAQTEKVNLNTATLEQLQTLPGIGEKRAADILADREANGSFSTPEDLIRVKGIGESILENLLDYITV